MLNGLIITAFVLWILGFAVNHITLYQILLIVPTILFAARKFGIHVKMSNICLCEGLFLFFSIMWKLLFHKFAWIPVLLTVLLRFIFIVIIIYDDTAYVYVQEERRKLR